MFDGFALSPLPCLGGESLLGFETSHRRRCGSGTYSWRNFFQCRGVEARGGIEAKESDLGVRGGVKVVSRTQCITFQHRTLNIGY